MASSPHAVAMLGSGQQVGARMDSCPSDIGVQLSDPVQAV